MTKIITQYFRQLTPFTQRLVAFAIFNLVMNLVLMLFSLDWREDSVIPHTVKFLAFFKQHDDSWGPMFNALEYLRLSHEKPIYSQLFLIEKVKFQYPLTSLLPLLLLEQLTSHRSVHLFILNFLSWLAIAVTIIFAVKIFKLSSDGFSTTLQTSKLDSIIRTFLLLVLGSMFYPVVKAHTLGQIQVFINCFFTLSVWFWIKRQEAVSGIFIGIMLLIKPQYLVIAVWGLLRKKYSFMSTLLAVFLAGVVCSVLLFGLSNNFDYLNVLKLISRTGESFYANQSINGLLNRLLFNGSNLKFEADAFPPFNSIVYVGTLLSSSLLLLSALVGFIRPDLRGDAIDFMIVTLSCTIASPVAWEHHYGILLVIYAFLLPYLLNRPIFGRRIMLLFILSYTLASNCLSIFNKLAYIPVLNILQSYLFVAALIVLVFLYAIGDAKFNLARLRR